jgi:ATP-binding cassette subfamily F protein 3
MLLQPANFLIMDEPTNHLDMKSERVLQEALSKYDGTFVIVSHDRAFLDPIVNKVLEVKPGSLRIFLGNLSDYLAKKKEELKQTTQKTEAAKEIKSGDTNTHRQQKQDRRKLATKEFKGVKKKVEDVEAEIHKLEMRKKEIEILLANPDIYKNGEEAKSISAEYKSTQTQLEKAFSKWSKLTEDLASFEL